MQMQQPNTLGLQSSQFTQNFQASPQQMDPSHMTMFTIPAGTILYHGTTTKSQFDTTNFRIGDETKVAYFSPQKRFAADNIKGCSKSPVEHGWIHKFRVNKDIDRIKIVSAFALDSKSTDKQMLAQYCNRYSANQTNGFGFFFPANYLKRFSVDGDDEQPQSIQSASQQQLLYESEFAICAPNLFMEYVSTERCMTKRKISKPYRFDQ